ncbi:MAG TPA: hypothetical protein VFJ30_08200, partial [Phycisphaerae bacterium]|nr:hypothetical protein [Phycisphaerae bacterium]
MRARISITGDSLLCRRDGTERGAQVRIPLTDQTAAMLGDWTRQYRGAVRAGGPAGLAGLGASMFD